MSIVPTKMNKVNTEVTPQDIMMIVDESGSMESMGQEPVMAVNAFISDQKKVSTGDGTTFTLWKFNSKVVKVLDDVPIQDVGEFGDYEPDLMTALNDAVCMAIKNKLLCEKNRNVVCVILTDGIENASQTFKSSDLNECISSAKKEYGWTFIYLGANQDAFSVGGSIGVGYHNCATFDSSIPGELTRLARQTSCAVSEYRRASMTSQMDGTDMPTMNLRSATCPVLSTTDLPKIGVHRNVTNLPPMPPSFRSGTPRKLRR